MKDRKVAFLTACLLVLNVMSLFAISYNRLVENCGKAGQALGIKWEQTARQQPNPKEYSLGFLSGIYKELGVGFSFEISQTEQTQKGLADATTAGAFDEFKAAMGKYYNSYKQLEGTKNEWKYQQCKSAFLGGLSKVPLFASAMTAIVIDGEDVAEVQLVAMGTKETNHASGFHLSVKNKTNSILKINWANSSFNYNGSSYGIFIEGQKYIDQNTPMNPTILPAKGSMSKEIFSSDQVYYLNGQYGGWRMNDIIASSVTIVLCIEQGAGESYYSITTTF